MSIQQVLGPLLSGGTADVLCEIGQCFVRGDMVEVTQDSSECTQVLSL